MGTKFFLLKSLIFTIFVKTLIILSSCSIFSKQGNSDYEYMLEIYSKVGTAELVDIYTGIDPQYWRDKTEMRASLSLGKYRFFIHPILRVGEVDHLMFYLEKLNLSDEILADSLSSLSERSPCFYVSYHIRDFNPELAHYQSLELEAEDRWGRFYQLYWIAEPETSVSIEEVMISGSTGSEREYRHWGVACSYTSFSLNDYFTVRVRPLENQFPFFGATATLTWDYRGINFPEEHPSHSQHGEGARSKAVQSYKGW